MDPRAFVVLTCPNCKSEIEGQIRILQNTFGEFSCCNVKWIVTFPRKFGPVEKRDKDGSPERK